MFSDYVTVIYSVCAFENMVQNFPVTTIHKNLVLGQTSPTMADIQRWKVTEVCTMTWNYWIHVS